MEHDFWHAKWQKKEIGFHQDEYNPLLMEHFSKLGVPEKGRVFVPLCGKTLDMSWFVSQGHQVVGVELSEIAVEQLFRELDIIPKIMRVGKLKCYKSEGMDIFAGDFFDLDIEHLGAVHAIYDRAALVALPEKMRIEYTSHLKTMTANAPQLLVCFEYEQSLLDGPPFSISKEELEKHYQQDYDLTLAATLFLEKGLKGKIDVEECAWLLQGKRN